MNSQPSRVPNLNIKKILGRKRYVPNLPVSRNVTPKVKLEENVEVNCVKKTESGSSSERRKPGRFEKKLLLGTDTFAPSTDTSRSRITIKSKPKITTSNSAVSSVKKEVVDQNDISNSIPSKSITGKFAQISSALPQDLPVSVPRPRLSLPDDSKKPISFLKDLFGPNSDESPLFILKTPKYLPGLLDNSKNTKLSTSKSDVKNEVQKCTMPDLPDGQIGTLQIMKSGRLRLVLGDCKFWLHRGVRVNFKEELAYVTADAETKTGEIVNIGNIKDRIIAVPESVTIFTDE